MRVAVAQRGQDADHGVQLPAITSNTEMPARKGGPSGSPGEAHQARDGLHHQVVARARRAGVPTEAADRGVDDARGWRRATVS